MLPTDSRFVDICFAQVRLSTLLEQKRHLDMLISDCELSIKELRSEIDKCSEHLNK